MSKPLHRILFFHPFSSPLEDTPEDTPEEDCDTELLYFISIQHPRDQRNSRKQISNALKVEKYTTAQS